LDTAILSALEEVLQARTGAEVDPCTNKLVSRCQITFRSCIFMTCGGRWPEYVDFPDRTGLDPKGMRRLIVQYMQ